VRSDSGAEPAGSLDELRGAVRKAIGWVKPMPGADLEVVEVRDAEGFSEQLVEYRNDEGERVRAFLLVPDGAGPFPGVVIYHQHNGERHLGKSEVAGHAGNWLQAFGPALAQGGVVVLAPDAICFEDRRRNATGTMPEPGDDLQHYNEAVYRLLRGSLLMSVVVADAALALSVLDSLDIVDADRVGAFGHSMGGHTVLFSAAVDDRVRFACISGAAGSYRQRIASQTGIQLAQVIPDFLSITDFDGLLRLIAPRPTLIVSATDDPYSKDADQIVDRAAPAFEALNAGRLLQHSRYPGSTRSHRPARRRS